MTGPLAWIDSLGATTSSKAPEAGSHTMPASLREGGGEGEGEGGPSLRLP